jgi:diadenosine tetraphosphate (Ap4A) HIT family hydrolase
MTHFFQHKGVKYSGDSVVGCLFCDIVAGSAPKLWYKDSQVCHGCQWRKRVEHDRFVSSLNICLLQVAVFAPRSPAAQIHLLVVPLRHIKDAGSLTSDDVPLLRHMYDVATMQLTAHAPFYFGKDRMKALTAMPAYDYNRGVLEYVPSSTGKAPMHAAPLHLSHPPEALAPTAVASGSSSPGSPVPASPAAASPSSAAAATVAAPVTASESLNVTAECSSLLTRAGTFYGFHVGGFNSIDHLHLHAQ